MHDFTRSILVRFRKIFASNSSRILSTIGLLAILGYLAILRDVPQNEHTRHVEPISAAAFKESLNEEKVTKLVERPRIAFWAKPYHDISYKFTDLANGDGGCDVSFDRKDVPNADAVVFFMKSCKPNDLPPPQLRRINQVYVWYSHESPWTTFNYYHHKLTEYDNYFNWTMSPRIDSDVIASMAPVPAMDYLMHRVGRPEEMVDKDLATNARLSLQEFESQAKVILAKKSHLIGWIVSDCDVTHGAVTRMKAIKLLEDTGIKISKFGKCVHNPLPFNFTMLFETLSSYKFYLAFENSLHCTDYLTEKTLYNAFVPGAVPVIYGPLKTDAEKILPKGSYIHVEDFENMTELADYLHHLDNNDSDYMEYFKWWMEPGAQTYPRFGFNLGPTYIPRIPLMPQYDKNDVQDTMLDTKRFGVYHLCRRLKRGDHVNQIHVVPDLARWWYGNETSECRN